MQAMRRKRRFSCGMHTGWTEERQQVYIAATQHPIRCKYQTITLGNASDIFGASSNRLRRPALTRKSEGSSPSAPVIQESRLIGKPVVSKTIFPGSSPGSPAHLAVAQQAAHPADIRKAEGSSPSRKIVVVADLAMQRIVVPPYGGSNPLGHLGAMV